MRSVRLISATEVRVLPAVVQLSVFQCDSGKPRVLLSTPLLTSSRNSTHPHSLLLPPKSPKLWTVARVSYQRTSHSDQRTPHKWAKRHPIFDAFDDVFDD